MQLINNWWPEKYRPKTLEDYVGNDDMIGDIKKWIESGEIPHLLFYSEKSGTGKTSAAKLIAGLLDSDILYINASEENSVDTVREKIKMFVSNIGFSKWKIVILDEFTATTAAQAALNNLMESYSQVARFILTCNYIDKVLPSIRSRCTAYRIETPPKVKVATRLAHILDQEGITYVPNDILKIVNWYYPDQRSMLNECYRCSTSGTLIPIENVQHHVEYMAQILSELNGTKKISNIRQIIADSNVRQFDDLFRFLYDHIDQIGSDSAMILYHLAEGQYKASLVIDPEIQVVNTLNNVIKELK